MRILVVRLSALGDIVHALPAITDLRRAHPQAIIDVATDERFVDIPSLHAGVDRVIPIALKRWKKSLSRRRTWHEMFQTLGNLRANAYDLVLDMHGLNKSAIVTWLARGALKLGPAARYCGEWLPPRVYEQQLDPPMPPDAVRRMRLFAALTLQQPLTGPPDFGLKVRWHGADARQVALVHGSAGEHKLWPQTHWIALGRELAAQGWRLVLPWGSEAERVRAERMAEAIGQAHCQIGEPQSIAQWAHQLSACRLVIGVDTGLTHLAAAAGVPCLSVFIGTDAALLVPQQPERARSLNGRGQPPDWQSAWSAARDLLDQTAGEALPA